MKNTTVQTSLGFDPATRNALDAMAQRNRGALDEALAAGATTWLREGFVRGDDGVMRPAAEEVAVPYPEPDEPKGWKKKFVDDDGVSYYDSGAVRAAADYWCGARARRGVRGRAARRATNARRKGSRRTSSARSNAPPSSDDPPDPEPPERRLCENNRCEADISHLGPKAYHCDNSGACKQAAYRDRLTHQQLDELVGTVADVSCTCSPKRNLVIGGVCFTCGKPRGVVTRDWLDDEMRARSFVSSRAPARRNPRYGDRKRRPPREYLDPSIREAVAA